MMRHIYEAERITTENLILHLLSKTFNRQKRTGKKNRDVTFQSGITQAEIKAFSLTEIN